MLTTEDYIIEKNPARHAAEDYKLLRETGLNCIQKLSSKVWTDYNVHDPGVTILELLCYAITDLGYRSTFDIQDIITPSGKEGPEMKNAFYSANEILTSHPITINDYRKLIIEKVPGVRNVWLEIKDDEVYIPAIEFDYKKNSNVFTKTNDADALKLKGLYRVKVELEDYRIIREAHPEMLEIIKPYKSGKTSDYKECYRNYIESILMNHRNISEDFSEVIILEETPVGICADIELKPRAKEEDVLLEIYRKLYEYVNPSIKLFTYQELLDKGRSIEQIFQGGSVDRGFIDYEELKAFDHKTVLHTSDIINILMDIEGVLNIRSIQFNNKFADPNSTNQNRTCLHLKDPKRSSFRFSFDINAIPQERLNKIIFRKGMIYFIASATKEWKFTEVIDYSEAPENFVKDLPLPSGSNRSLDEYISIQDEFPKVYMTGQEGIPDSASDLRKAQRLQLKAYLLFFDQLLADYLAQLNDVKNLLSWRDPDAEPTYHIKKLSSSEINDFDKLLSNYSKYQYIVEPEKLEKDRRNRLLDHLIARFNEKFVDYTVFKFLQDEEGSSYAKPGNNEIIHDKKNFLNHYPLISRNRSHAIDYTRLLSTKNYNMLEFRISKALGVNSDHMNRNLAPEVVDPNPDKMIFKNNSRESFNKTFGLHIYEHILFRPLYNDAYPPVLEFLKLYFGDVMDKNDYALVPDPYSMKVTVAVPGWLAISGRMEFRKFVEQKIRMEMPAHVALKICWINPRQMFEIENHYKAFLKQMSILFAPGNRKKKKIISDYKNALNLFVETLSSLNNMYPPSLLDSAFDFISGKSELTPVILDNTALSGEEDNNWAFEEKIKIKAKTKKKKEGK